jgi:hypothetical protein
MQLPKSRTQDIVVRKLADETLVYDRKTLQASCLNSLAADVWERCDGETSVSAIAASISSGRDEPVEESAVWAALERLSGSNLLEHPIAAPTFVNGRTSRRGALRAIGLGTAAAIPAVTTIVLPSMAEAASCAAAGSPCDFDNPGACCSLTCAASDNGPVCL